MLSMGTNTGMQGGLNVQSTSSPQRTSSPQPKTYNPQGNNVNPMNVAPPSPYVAGTLGLTSGGGTVAAPVVDPYAEWGGRASYDRLVSGFDTQKASIYDSAVDAARTSGLGIRNSILDFIDAMRTGQTGIDNRAINNELAKQRGTADVYGSMNRGIRSGGVTLANRNAGDSSAAGAIARAYGDIGRRQMSDIGNQYELENQDVALAQTDLERQRASGLRRIDTSIDQTANSIVAEGNNKLAALDAAMANASLPDRIALDAEKQKIRAQVLAELGKYDNNLGDVNKISAMDRNRRIAEATRRGSLGMAPEAQFDYTDVMPGGLEGTGPVSSELPIFTYRDREDQ